MQPVTPPMLEAPMFENLSLDLRGVWSAVYRNRYVVVIVLVLALIAGIITTMLMTRRYQAAVTLQIEQQAARVFEKQDADQAELGGDEERFLQTQIDILESRTIRQQVVRRLKLDQNDSFFIRMGMRTPMSATGLSGVVDERRKYAVSILGQNLEVMLPRASRVVAVKFSGPDPILAAEIANAIAETYIQFNLQHKLDTSAYARNFIESQLAITKQRLEDSERGLIEYARQARLIDTGSGDASANGGPRSLTASNLVQINTAYAQASAVRVLAQTRWEQAQRSPLMSLPEVLGNETVQALVQRRAAAQAQYDQDRQRRKEDFPTMKQAAANIAQLTTQIQATADAIRTSFQDQYLTAQKAEDALNARLGQLKNDTLAEQDRTVRYTILKREADTNRTLYEGLLQRYKELSASAGLLSNNISIVDKAYPPGAPISPKLWLNLLISLVAGAIIAGAVVMTREKLDDVILQPDDITRKLHETFLNTTPSIPSGISPWTEMKNVRSPLSEAYYALRTSIELTLPGGTPHTILFTSTRQAEGKSTSAAAIAQNFARTGKRVLLIDMDLRKPSLHHIFKTPHTNGIVNVLVRSKTIDEVKTVTEIPNLDFVACGPLPPNPAELLSGSALPELIARIRGDYDHIILDGPPVLGLADAVLLGNVTDAVIFVVEFNSSRSGQAKVAINRLRAGGAYLLGVVLTKYDSRKTGYGDEYGYGYTYGAEPPPV
jgi:succinoglycan biosynthesis transport protein ExoP